MILHAAFTKRCWAAGCSTGAPFRTPPREPASVYLQHVLSPQSIPGRHGKRAVHIEKKPYFAGGGVRPRRFDEKNVNTVDRKYFLPSEEYMCSFAALFTAPHFPLNVPHQD